MAAASVDLPLPDEPASRTLVPYGLQQHLRAIGADAKRDGVASKPWFEIAQIDGK